MNRVPLAEFTLWTTRVFGTLEEEGEGGKEKEGVKVGKTEQGGVNSKGKREGN